MHNNNAPFQVLVGVRFLIIEFTRSEQMIRVNACLLLLNAAYAIKAVYTTDFSGIRNVLWTY